MREILHSCSRSVDALNSFVAHAVRWLAVIMVIITFAVVVLRYVFNIGAIGMQESVMYMHGLLFLLGIPYSLLMDSHVRVDLLYSRLSTKQQGRIDIAGHILFLLPVSAFMFVTSLPYVSASWRVLEGSAEVGGIPGVFLLKTLIPVMAALLFLQGVSQIFKLLLSSEE